MATVRDITTMCKAGQIEEAYALAKTDMEAESTNVWAQRELGWALYYMMKQDVASRQFESLLAHLEELRTLNLLTLDSDSMIFDNVAFAIGGFVKDNLPPSAIDTPVRLSHLFAVLKKFTFSPSKGYTFILERVIKCEAWTELLDFLEWWDFNNLREEDFLPVQLDNGKRIMSVSERAYIAKSKALIRKNDLGMIEEFLPKLDELIKAHPEMTYPGYFYGKLLLSLGTTTKDALRVVIPFARKKATEFWVWQLLSDVFDDDNEKQLACLLRAVHSRTQESFLGKVRIKLADLCIRRNELELAKFQIDKVVKCYLSNGWHLPKEVDYWIHQDWVKTITGRDVSGIDYNAITDNILYDSAEEAVAVVSYYDTQTKKASLIYGHKQRMSQRIRFKVGAGTVLKIHFVKEDDGRLKLLRAEKSSLPTDLEYAKFICGTIRKREEQPYAFIKFDAADAFVAPNVVSKYGVEDGECVQCLVVYDYNKKKDSWNWVVISINKNIENK